MDPPASGRAGEGAETHTHTHTPAAASGEGGEGRREGGRGGGEDAHARPAPSRRPRRAPRRPRPAGCRAGRGPAGSRCRAFCTQVRAAELPSRPVTGVASLPSPLLQSRCHFSVKNLSPFHFAFKEPGFVAFSEWKHKAASGMAPPQASASSGLQKPRFSWEYRSSLSALEKPGGKASGYQSTKKKQTPT